MNQLNTANLLKYRPSGGPFNNDIVEYAKSPDRLKKELPDGC